VLYDAAVSVERASNPGGTAFSLCNKGWFPLWQNGEVGGGSEVPIKLRSAALPHVMSGMLADTFDAAVSVYMESVNISGVQGQPALSLHDVQKASLQRVKISGSVGGGALGASYVTGLLMLQCQVENNSADLAVDGLISGGGTFTAVRSLYLLDTEFASNVGPAAGAMLLQSCGAVIINSCKFDNNTSSQSGGAVRAIASDSMVVDTSTSQQPQVIDCLPPDVLGVDSEGFNSRLLDQTVLDREGVHDSCTEALLGGQATTFGSNVAGASGGAIAIEGLMLAAFNATRVNFWDNR
jgi:predicted outer membrane repeat protein